MNEKATIFDYARMCNAENKHCSECPLSEANTNSELYCESYLLKYPDKANKIILDWCKTHPVKTRQSEFLKMFPNVIMTDGVIDICPKRLNRDFVCIHGMECKVCLKGYWSKEVKENEKD